MNTSNLLIENGYRVTILVLDITDKSFYPVNEKVNVVQQPLSFGITKDGNIITRKIKMLSDVLKLRKLIPSLSPDWLIATEYPFASAAILAGGKKNAKILSWEHHHFYEIRKNQFWNRIFFYTYPKLDTIITLNKDEERLFKEINPRVCTIPNFIEGPAQAPRGIEKKKILTIGRLAHVKGIDMLIPVAKKVFEKFPEWKWSVIGTGELEATLKEAIQIQGLSNNIDVESPSTHEIFNRYLESDLYVMLSRNECLPMTLLEAQAAGLPCISFDCESGPRHIIKNGETGLLVEKENINMMADAICRLIGDKNKRQVYSENAKQHAENFRPEKIFQLWKQLLNEGRC